MPGKRVVNDSKMSVAGHARNPDQHPFLLKSNHDALVPASCFVLEPTPKLPRFESACLCFPKRRTDFVECGANVLFIVPMGARREFRDTLRSMLQVAVEERGERTRHCLYSDNMVSRWIGNFAEKAQ